MVRVQFVSEYRGSGRIAPLPPDPVGVAVFIPVIGSGHESRFAYFLVSGSNRYSQMNPSTPLISLKILPRRFLEHRSKFNE